ncbi:hypothetical protein CPB84DRAFT_1779984 [Gymnopilus junonius]|uniref:Uncharacterized protein n=1 Tax=Gymnopilus junonius TaxID=109634 RepID=A0A9P5TNF3_GYMJU|nr:hypothetical protein CPB84DRAFT_1779984 [Gymnopilus junonius]
MVAITHPHKLIKASRFKSSASYLSMIITFLGFQSFNPACKAMRRGELAELASPPPRASALFGLEPSKFYLNCRRDRTALTFHSNFPNPRPGPLNLTLLTIQGHATYTYTRSVGHKIVVVQQTRCVPLGPAARHCSEFVPSLFV